MAIRSWLERNRGDSFGDEMILGTVIEWSRALPLWQQDAIRRLYSCEKLSASDFDDIYALLRQEHGIPDVKLRVAETLSGEISESSTPDGARVRLTAVKDLKNVNALAEKQVLPIQQAGITAIYGHNGSGKSGYSRALKRACRARDQSERILPNAQLASVSNSPAEAVFELLVNGATEDIKWVDGTVASDLLAHVSIFDAHCAKAYLNTEDEFSYLPYGLDILEELARACTRLKGMLEDDCAKSSVVPSAFSHIPFSTAAGKLVSQLSAKSDAKLVETLSVVSPSELARMQELERSLKENNPKEKAAQLRLRAGRLTKFAERCSEKLTLVGDQKIQTTRCTVEAYKVAKIAAEISARQFSQMPGLMSGTGGDVWQELFEAARKFAAHSHPEADFPRLSPEDSCPLCQQPLGEGAQRLVLFDTFIQQEAEKSAREKRAAAVAAYDEVRHADLNLLLDAELTAELTELNEQLAKECASLQVELTTRRETIKAACGDEGDWGSLSNEPSNPCEKLKELAEGLRSQASALEKAADAIARDQLQKEQAELHARILLSEVKPAVLDAITKLKHIEKLKKCLVAVRTNSITLKSSELTQEIVAKGLAQAMNDEFKQLGVNELHVALQSQSVKGKARYKLVLELPGTNRLGLILSEGEQRAIAIASFLAEVRVSNSTECVIFDDPVCSLDHRRRELVVSRLVKEAQTRQVVVFTHDVYFLCLLQQQADYSGVNISSLSLHRGPGGFGIADSSLPFQGAPTARRVGMLKQMQVACAKLYKEGDELNYQRRATDTYFHLRLAWERGVEEVLFKGVVTRFGEGVRTQLLAQVTVDDEDYAAVAAGMTKCSKYAHDKAALGDLSIPSPDELDADISALEAWRKRIEDRSASLKKQRAA